MNYELAKKLKDCGCPFKMIDAGMCVPDKYIDFNPEGDQQIGAQHFFIPTLSELIEACQKEGRWLSLNGFGNEWEAASARKEPHGLTMEEWVKDRKSIEGKTPEEAIGNLYIALQTK